MGAAAGHRGPGRLQPAGLEGHRGAFWIQGFRGFSRVLDWCLVNSVGGRGRLGGKAGSWTVCLPVCDPQTRPACLPGMPPRWAVLLSNPPCGCIFKLGREGVLTGWLRCCVACLSRHDQDTYPACLHVIGSELGASFMAQHVPYVSLARWVGEGSGCTAFIRGSVQPHPRCRRGISQAACTAQILEP